METATNCIAHLALVEIQSDNTLSSYVVVFRRLAENNLKAFKFEAMATEAPGAKDANEARHHRVLRTRSQFSDAGRTCLKLTLLQLQGRFPKVSTEVMACILLDPRTKSRAKRIAVIGDIPCKEEKAMYKNGIGFVRDEHRKVCAQMTKQGKLPLSQESHQSSHHQRAGTTQTNCPNPLY
ncbi:hypothetical protein PC110_g13594 [Phytophthora cactorum]|uniref:Uncharacterized protein n=1 Tax=Phytophthora cactorum TaxID=29920 RepID=A0A329RZK9_9STRA|nr:hypothetical protein PC110_g13594 [Phytophthora cactorum]